MKTLLLPLAFALILPGLGSAQTPRGKLPKPASRTELIAFLKSNDPVRKASAFETAVAVMTGELTRADLPPDVVASDMVDVAASDAPTRSKVYAVTALIRAHDADKANPYRGAGPRLVEAYHRSSDVGVRRVAMGGIVKVSDAQFALVFLKPIARNADRKFDADQSAAINLIAQLNTDASVSFLRDLHSQGVVTEEWPRGALDRLAASGYRAPPERRDPPK